MFLVISQVIVLLAGSGSINQLPESFSVYEQGVTLDDLKAVNVDLNEVRKSLNEIKSDSDSKDDPVEVKNAESNSVVVPPTLEDLKEVNIDLNKVRQSLNEIKSNSDSEDDPVEVKKVESKPVVVPPAPVVVKKDKENIKPERIITENEKAVLVEKSPVVVIPVPVSDDDETIQSIEEPADEVIIVTEVKPAYIKHDTKGNSLEDDMEQWTCVFDTNTGLMWEVKSEEDVMRNSNNLYSWYNPEHETLQGKADGGRCKGDADCDTHAYVKILNKQNYCGHNDWHLPSREQMQTLVDFENGDVKINNQYFPRTKPSWYWTSTENSNKNDHAWYVLFRNGHALSDLKERPKHIRLVRVATTNLSSN